MGVDLAAEFGALSLQLGDSSHPEVTPNLAIESHLRTKEVVNHIDSDHCVIA